MEKISLRSLSFGSYVKLFALSGVGSGVVIGVLIFIIALLGGNAHANIGNIRFEGVPAGAVSLLMGPVLGGLIFAWFAVVMYWPFKLILKMFGSIEFTALAEGAHTQEEEDTPREGE